MIKRHHKKAAVQNQQFSFFIASHFTVNVIRFSRFQVQWKK